MPPPPRPTIDAPPVSVGALRAYQRAHGLTRPQLAERLGIAMATLGRLLTGEERPSRPVALLLARLSADPVPDLAAKRHAQSALVRDAVRCLGSQVALAAVLGVTPGAVHLWLTGRRRLAPARVVALRALLAQEAEPDDKKISRKKSQNPPRVY